MVGEPLGYWKDKRSTGGAPVIIAKTFVYFDYYDTPRVEAYNPDEHLGLVDETQDFQVAPYHLCVWKDGA